MAKDEIRIDEYEIENCKGNINLLKNEWENLPSFSISPSEKSSGYSAERINDCSDTAHRVSKSFSLLLSNSIAFFESVGVSFKETDEKAASSFSGGGGGSRESF